MAPREPTDAERLAEVVKRSLGARDVRLEEVAPVRAASAPELPELRRALGDGRELVVVFDPPAPDLDTVAARLEALVSSFEGSLRESGSESTRPPRMSAEASLHEELETLAARAGALDALVVDLASPVVWGSAGNAESQDDAGELPEGPARAAIADVHAVSSLRAAQRGKHLRHLVRRDGLNYVAHSFGGIYVLLLVFADMFDELRAERAIGDSLPRVERIVMRLPPRDPAPTRGGAVIRLRRLRRT